MYAVVVPLLVPLHCIAWALNSGEYSDRMNAGAGYRQVSSSSTVTTSLALQRLPTRMARPRRTVFLISFAALVTLIIVQPLVGYLSDEWGHRRLLLLSIGSILLLGHGTFSLTQSSSAWTVLLGQILMAVMLGITGGVTPALMVELTPASERCTTLGFGHNVSSALLGGLTPLLATLLVQRTGTVVSAVWLWQGAAVITLMALLSQPRRQS